MKKEYTTTDKAAAKKIAAKLNNTYYYLGNGEYARPEYKVRKIRGCDEYKIYAKYYYFAGTCYRLPNGPISEETAYHA